MSLSATVRCRCWEDNALSSPPPLRDHIKPIEGTNTLHLDLPWDGNQAKHDAFDKWLETCCRHPRMEYAHEYVSNWGGLRLFQAQLETLGLQQFPVLRDHLPQANDGLVPSNLAAATLAELDDFSHRSLGLKTVLINADTGERIAQYIPAYEGIFISAHFHWRAGVDPEGFFILGPARPPSLFEKLINPQAGFTKTVPIRTPLGSSPNLTITRTANDPLSRLRRWMASRAQNATKVEKFRSRKFTQTQLGTNLFQLTDLPAQKAFISPIGIATYDINNQPSYPQNLSVELRPQTAEDFDYILKPLKTLFQASLATGHPVEWL